MRRFLLFVGLLFPISMFAQNTNAPLNSDYYHLLDRYEIRQKKFSKSFFTVAKPYTREAIAAFVDSLKLDGLSKSDQFNLGYLRNDNWEWTDQAENDSKKPIFKHFYKKQSDLYHVQTKDFDLHVNPVLYLSLGNDGNLDATTFTNTRGVQIRGNIGKKLGFYAFVSENQIRFPQYVTGFAGDEGTIIPSVSNQNAVPAEGFWKVYQEDGYDFFNARGYITFKAFEQVSFQFGHDRNFFGNGYRSLILSDHATNYLFMRINTKVWRLNYTNIAANIAPFALKDGDQFSDKYFAYHHLSVNITDNFNIGFFESVTFGREDSLQNNEFDLNYINPLIFLRGIEQNRASLDNVILGIDWKWNLWGKIQLYSQVVLDEFLFDDFFSRNGNWRNKQAMQLGFKYIDVAGISNLDIQGEFNVVRPYMYTHFDRNGTGEQQYSNYQHFGQPLAHPLSANFMEFIGIARYQPLPRLQLTGKLMYVDLGEDRPGENWGGNLFKDYVTRAQDLDNRVGQGVNAKLFFGDFTASYQLRHNLFLDLKQVIRRFNSEDDARDHNTNFTSFALRWNIPQRLNEF
ncbi:MAG: hypothetical protein ACPGJS_00035 [Flammeovirgaceae bacterium]